MITVGCILQAHHRLPKSTDVINFETPQGRRMIQDRFEARDRARIVTLLLSAIQAEKIRVRLWPDEDLLGATGRRGFSIETPEQVAVVNEILMPQISIDFSLEHIWMLQTWLETVN